MPDSDKNINEQVEQYFNFLKDQKPENTIFPLFHGSVSEKEILFPHGLNLDKEKSTISPKNKAFNIKVGAPLSMPIEMSLGDKNINQILNPLKEMDDKIKQQESTAKPMHTESIGNRLGKSSLQSNHSQVYHGGISSQRYGVSLNSSSSSSSGHNWSNKNAKQSSNPMSSNQKLAEEDEKIPSSLQKKTEENLKTATSPQKTTFAQRVIDEKKKVNAQSFGI